MKRVKNVKKRRRVWIWILLVFILSLLAGGVAGAVYLAPYAKERMDMSLLELPEVNRPAVLYVREPACRATREGELSVAPNALISPAERRSFVPIEEMPPHLLHAFVAIEDKRFYRHAGVDPVRTARAVMGYLGGNASFGGSTITQQLVKNLTGHDEATPDRKVREIFLALDLERHADKSAVLECYLNIINLAEGCRGVGAAAMRYFSKAPGELTLPECATLAAITQNPAKYNPLRHPEAARVRRDVILREMAAQGYITAEELTAALATAMELHPGSLDTGGTEETEKSGVCSWYADMVVEDVIRDLCSRLGYSRATASELVYAGGLSIDIAMDPTLQSIVEAYFSDPDHFPVGEDGRPQAALILVDPLTGDILAVAGAVGEKTANRVQNYATDTRRPAGSCLKPLSVYAPALEEGRVTWATVLEDAPISEKGGVPWPRNADGLYRGRVTVGASIAESLNTVAVRLLETVGADTSLSYLRDRFGLELGDDASGSVSALALGQGGRGVTLRELTAAYTAFPGGVVHAAVSYHRVLDREGHVLLENPLGEGRAALSPETAALMTRLLEGVTDHGTAARYITVDERLGIATAGKTGTTQNNCDRRFVGMTPRLVGGVWMGYDYPAELRGIPGNPCVGIWDEVLGLCEQAYTGAPPRSDFDLGMTLIESEFCPLSGGLPNPFCTHPVHGGVALERGWFSVGQEPRVLCDAHEEPPIILIPDDRFPDDPGRIPLLPGEILPAEETDRARAVPWSPRSPRFWRPRR